MGIRRTTTDGHSLLGEAEALITKHQDDLAAIVDRANSRHDDINLRQVELENEKKALGKVRQLIAG